MFCFVLPWLCKMAYIYSQMVVKLSCGLLLLLLLVLVMVCIYSLMYLEMVKMCTMLGFISFLLQCFKAFMYFVSIEGKYLSSLLVFQILFAFVLLFSPSMSADDQSQYKPEFLPVFSSYGLYLFCSVLMVGNFVQSLITHMKSNYVMVAALDQAIWSIPAFVGLTGFNFKSFFNYLIKTIKDYPGPYIYKVIKLI